MLGAVPQHDYLKEAVLLGKVSMILKIASLSAINLASLTAYLASSKNIIDDAFAIDRNVVESSGSPAYAVNLMTSKSVDHNKHDVTLEIAETFILKEDKESQLCHHVPSKYLLGLVQAIGLFPKS